MTDDLISQAPGLIMHSGDGDAEADQRLLRHLSTYQQRPTADPQPGPAIDGLSEDDVHVRLAVLIRDIQNRPPTEVAMALGELTATAVQHLPGAQYAGITVTDGRGRIDTPSAVGPYPGLLDSIQQRHHEGPSLQAIRQHDTVRVDDLNTEARWPNYRGDALAQSPIRSVLSFALSADQHALGALNFYAERPHAFDADSERLGFVYATHVALAWNALRRETQFRDALASRDIIGQAKGMLMERHQINAEEAFGLLRQLSQESNTPVAELARRIAHP
jgi:GAF domain-containing protein